MTPAEQLRAAKALIDTPEKWIKGEYARDNEGCPVDFNGEEATCFCAVGALGWAGAALDADCRARKALIDALPAGWQYANTFNDDPATTHADIMKLFDDAIALAEADQ